MACRLCLAESRLVNSHILSEFLYEGMYDEDHRFFALSSNPSVKDRVLQKGLREPLLCEKCDNEILSGYERYAQKVLYGGQSVLSIQDGNSLRFKGLYYTKLRLFYLSILWRMSVSSKSTYSAVSLGPHEEIIRRMLLEGRPGEPDEYGLICVAPLFDSQYIGSWMLPPDSVKQYVRRIYRCLIAGLLYNFFVGKAKLPTQLSDLFIQKDGSWVIIREKIERVKFLHDYCFRLSQAMNHRKQVGGSRV